MNRKLNPPAVWRLVARPDWGNNCQQWQMIQEKEDAELPNHERRVYKREFYTRLSFEDFLRDRYRAPFVMSALKAWDNPL